MDAINSNFDNFENALYKKSVSLPLRQVMTENRACEHSS